ncbi:upstream-binding factor 1-like protein 1 [Sorex araneus]|uniref:upstream-binding factor 1-like protein 1 n=1 Tax=Sorex araneus TaxID=42254 RepID=UPI0024336C17|nr:upstream-binding factor 1-like protein 1 [Sorex araneus]
MALPQGQDDWCKEDSIQLLERMEDNLSDDDNTFKTTQSKLDWDKIAFKDFSGETCKLKWLQISNNLRKFRTLKELVLDAKERVGKPYKRKSCKRHHDLPKKPLTAYFRFFKEQRLQYSQMHPPLNSKELTKVLSKKYKELPKQEKEKYIQDFQREKQEFEQKLTQFREEHPDLAPNSKRRRPVKGQKKGQENVQDMDSLPKSGFPHRILFHGEPPKPPMHGYYKFHQDLWSSEELQDVPLKKRMVEICRRWQRVPQSQKELYEQEAKDLQVQYKTDLDRWLRTLSPQEYAAYREISYAKPKSMGVKGDQNTNFSLQSSFVRDRFGEEPGLQAPGIEESSGNSEDDSYVCVD